MSTYRYQAVRISLRSASGVCGSFICPALQGLSTRLIRHDGGALVEDTGWVPRGTKLSYCSVLVHAGQPGQGPDRVSPPWPRRAPNRRARLDDARPNDAGDGEDRVPMRRPLAVSVTKCAARGRSSPIRIVSTDHRADVRARLGRRLV